MINREYKDRLFTKIFGREEHRSWILSLYNAVNGTSYTDADAIEINTMEDVLYMGMKNDVSFLLGCEMNVYEHQSTYNPNMPVRMLSYLGMLYRKYLDRSGRMIYGTKLITVPLPKLVVFYNGKESAPDETMLHLYDAFPDGMDRGEADVTVRVRMLNINYDHNRALMEACKPLSEYAWFVAKVRTLSKTADLETAIDSALNDMPKGFEIREYLTGNRAEVKMDFLTEYNEAEVMAYLREEAIEMGREKGIAEGREKGRAEGRAEGREDMIQKFTAFFMQENPSLSREAALERVRAIAE